MSSTIVEGVDNEVLLAFVVLIIVGVFTLLYYFNTSGQSSFNLVNTWQYLRNLFEGEFEDARNEERQSPDGTSSETNDNGNVQDGPVDSVDRQETSRAETAHDSQQINSNFAGPSRPQTEESLDVEGQNCRPGAGTSEETPESATESQSEPGHLTLRVKHHEVERNYIVGANTTVGELKR